MTIDNFDIFESKLTFVTPNDRYIIHILRRQKDCKTKNNLGSNECQRLIRTYYIDSIEYFNKKREAIKELCRANNARAYILPQVRDNVECLWNLSFKIQDAIHLNNTSVKPEHLIRGAYCDCHKSRAKKWIIDLDNDEMYGWTVGAVVNYLRDNLEACGKDPNDMYLVPTKNGTHIVTTPFNLQSAAKVCDMFFEGHKNMTIRTTLTYGPNSYQDVVTNVTGWLHKDGMSLLFYDDATGL